MKRILLFAALILSLSVPARADGGHEITGFETLSAAESFFVLQAGETPSSAVCPETLTVYLDGNAAPVEIPVTWFCVNADADDCYYQFSPQWDTRRYTLAEGLDVLRDAPYIGVFVSGDAEASLLSVTGSPNETTVYQYLTNDMGLNCAAACGVLANIKAESDFNPHALGDKGTSYGICQWHNERWDSLKAYCAQNGYDDTTLTGQLHYLEYELKKSYSRVWKALQSVPDTADGAYEAASVWCVQFEIPANKDAVAIVRGNMARDRYWPEYSQPTVYYQVRFDAQGGAVDPETKDIEANAPYGTLPTPVRKGYYFLGWGDSVNPAQSKTVVETDYPAVQDNHTLYAHWTPNRYTVTLDPNGGTVSTTTHTVLYDRKYSFDSGILPTPTRDEFRFSGWYTAASGGTKITNDTLYTVAGDQTLYAHWISVHAPDVPKILTETGKYYRVGQEITVTWEASARAESYVYYLTEFPEKYAYTTNTATATITETSVTFKDLTAGYYSFFMHATNSYGWSEQSGWISFYVYEEDYIPTVIKSFNGHLYALYDYSSSWSFAESLCVNFGGHLVSITSAEEEAFIVDLIGVGSKGDYWIGAANYTPGNEKDNGDWHWTSGETFSYSAWATGQPDSYYDGGTREHWGGIRKSYGNLWNDFPNQYRACGFILELAPDESHITARDTFAGHTYLLIDNNTTWTEARAYCKLLGGYLAEVNSAAEKTFLDTFLDNGKRYWYLLGGRKENNRWIWDNAFLEPVNYIQWSADEGRIWNNTYLMIYKGSKESVSFRNAYYPPHHIKSIGFVCELDTETRQTAVESVSRDGNGDITAVVVCDDAQAVIFCVTYRDNGQMVSVASEAVGGMSSHTFRFSDAACDYALVFIVDGDCVPLCEPKRI
ncbi:MAG: InlB B-repeat-containing protein [Oscillospiraceae bacterium]|nr:InlB B-repeat-containing protein [Oscillospiraceae bacterium]